MQIEGSDFKILPARHQSCSHLKRKEEPEPSPRSTGEEVDLSRKAKGELAEKRLGTSSDAAPLSDKASSPKKSKWTVLIYMAGDNDLEEYITKNLVDMQKVGSSGDINIVAQLDRGPNPTDIPGGKRDCIRYYVTKVKDPKGIESKVVQSLGPTNMGSPETLKDFIAWGMKNYPADHYLVILNDHGAGFAGALQDVTSNSFMSLPDIQKGLKEGEADAGVSRDKVILGFDACLMGQAEVAYQMRDVADILVSSEETIGGAGMPYVGILSSDRVLRALKKVATMEGKMERSMQKISGTMDPRQVAEMIINECAKVPDVTMTMSATDLTKINVLKDAIDAFGKAIIAGKSSRERVKKHIEASQHYTMGMEQKPYSEMRDIYDIARRIAGDPEIRDKSLQSAAKKVMEAIDQVIIKEEHLGEGMENSHGLSIYSPTEKGGFDGYKYENLDLARDTRWDEAMKKFTGKPKDDSMWHYELPKAKEKKQAR